LVSSAQEVQRIGQYDLPWSQGQSGSDAAEVVIIEALDFALG
jgi:hypothetical protein